MKKFLPALVVLLVVCGLFPSKGFSYYENKLYCSLSKDSILISLNVKDGALCTKYIRSLELSMKTTYTDILSIQKYIDKKQDIGYRKPLKDQKGEYLNSLQSVRLNILAHMKSFEDELLKKSKEYFLQSITTYQKQLRLALKKFSASPSIRNQYYITQINQQFSCIQSMSDADSFEIFALNLQKYLYIKQQFLGK